MRVILILSSKDNCNFYPLGLTIRGPTPVRNDNLAICSIPFSQIHSSHVFLERLQFNSGLKVHLGVEGSTCCQIVPDLGMWVNLRLLIPTNNAERNSLHSCVAGPKCPGPRNTIPIGGLCM